MDKAQEKFLYAGLIIGYREWKINCINENGIYIFKLGGIGTGDNGNTWNNGINIAKCLKEKSKHSVPDFNCDCGFWAYNNKMDMLISMVKSTGEFGSYMNAGLSSYTVSIVPEETYYISGEVQFTGTLIEHEEGYRAEKAEIKKLLWIYKDKELSFKFERQLTDKERLEIEQVERKIQQTALDEAIARYGHRAQQTAYQQTATWISYLSCKQMPVLQPILPSQQQSLPLRQGYSGYQKQMFHKSFKKEEVMKALQDYYKVPIIYWKDYIK